MEKRVKKMVELQEHDQNRAYANYLRELKTSDILRKLLKHKRRWRNVDSVRLMDGHYYIIRRVHPYKENGEPVLWRWGGLKGWVKHTGILDKGLPKGATVAEGSIQVYDTCR